MSVLHKKKTRLSTKEIFNFEAT